MGLRGTRLDGRNAEAGTGAQRGGLHLLALETQTVLAPLNMSKVWQKPGFVEASTEAGA